MFKQSCHQAFTLLQARAFYCFQMAIENIHSGAVSAAHGYNHSVLQTPQQCLTTCPNSNAEMYSLLLETYIKDPQEKTRLFHAIDNIPAIQRKAEWAMKWIQRCT